MARRRARRPRPRPGDVPHGQRRDRDPPRNDLGDLGEGLDGHRDAAEAGRLGHVADADVHREELVRGRNGVERDEEGGVRERWEPVDPNRGGVLGHDARLVVFAVLWAR